MTNFINKYKHAWVVLYFLIYIPWFVYLEDTVTTNFNLIHSPLDDLIPFCEYFIIPYYLWFLFIAITCIFFFFSNTRDFYRLIIFLVVGMTLFLVISTIYPNGQNLRPDIFPRDNIFVDMVKNLYVIDTPTNILPSIHVYNSLAAYAAIYNNQKLRNNKWINIPSFILTLLIIMATVFLKQHSIIDVFSAFFIAIPMYYILYIHRFKNKTIYYK